MDWQTVILGILGGASGYGIFRYLIEIRQANDRRATEIPKQWAEISDKWENNFNAEQQLRQRQWEQWQQERNQLQQELNRVKIEYELNREHSRQLVAQLQGENELLKKRVKHLEEFLHSRGFDTGELKRRD